MQRRYEREIKEGKLLVADPGLDIYNQIISALFEEYTQRETEERLNDMLNRGFTILKEESEQPLITRVESITFKEKKYFLETRYNVHGVPEFLLYNQNLKTISESNDMDEIIKALQQNNQKKD